MKKLITGIKPTGDIHLGNYIGTFKRLVDLQKEYASAVFIADFHALNQLQDAKQLSHNTLELAKAFLAMGLDPKKTILFRQSAVPQTTELCWIFNSITPMSLLELSHAYKDAKAKEKSVKVGLFDYPVLMAADILIYNADVVPVGQDQRQHIEITRDIAKFFNNAWGETFTIPKELIEESMAVIPGTDGRKMSKSYGNDIGLFDTEKVTTKKVMSIVTDSKGADEPKDPDTCNVFALHKFFSTHQLKDLEKRYKAGTISYKESKELLATNINDELHELREEKAELDKHPEKVEKILEEGGEKARELAEKTMQEVRKKIGTQYKL